MPYEELIDLLSSRNALIVHCSRPGKGDEGLNGRLFPNDLRDAIKVCETGVGDVSCSVIWPGHCKTFGSIGIVLKPRSIAAITSAHPTDAGTVRDTNGRRTGLGTPTPGRLSRTPSAFSSTSRTRPSKSPRLSISRYCPTTTPPSWPPRL